MENEMYEWKPLYLNLLDGIRLENESQERFKVVKSLGTC
jgi:hypothetical protein